MRRHRKRERAPKLLSGSAPAGPLVGVSFEVWTRPSDGSRHGRRCSLVPRAATSEVIVLHPDAVTVDDLGWPKDLHCGPELGYAPLIAAESNVRRLGSAPSSSVRYGEYEEPSPDDIVYVGDRAYRRGAVIDLDDYAQLAAEVGAARQNNEAAREGVRYITADWDDPCGLRWSTVATALRSSRRASIATSMIPFPELRAFEDETKARHDEARARLRERLRAVGAPLLRSGRLAMSLAAQAALDDYHHSRPGPKFAALRDAADEAMEESRQSGHVVPLDWQSRNALSRVLYSGGQEMFPFYWAARVAENPDETNDMHIALQFIENGIENYMLRTAPERVTLLNVPALRVLGSAMAGYRAQLERIATSSPTQVVVRSPTARGDLAPVAASCAPYRRIYACGQPGGSRRRVVEIVAAPTHALRCYEDAAWVLGEVEDEDAAGEVDRVADLAAADPDVLRELEANGVTSTLAHRVAFRAGLPKPAPYGRRHSFW